MFFPYFSNGGYSESEWPAVWEYESAINSVLMAELDYPQAQSPTELKNDCLDLIHHLKADQTQNTLTPESFLDRELDSVWNFFSEHKTAGLKSSDLKNHLYPTDELKNKIKLSPSFREYLASRKPAI